MAKITAEKIKIFLQFDGDADSLARSGAPETQQLFEANEWHLISSLFQDGELVARKLASKEYEQKFMMSLHQHSDPLDVDEIKKIILR